MTHERWEWVPNYQGIYKASDQGRVYSVRRPNTKGGILKPRKNKYGYVTVVLYENGEPITKTIHRLVAQTFISNPENKPQINHLNGKKLDNNVSNLEWVTGSENVKHAHRTGLKINLVSEIRHLRGGLSGFALKLGELFVWLVEPLSRKMDLYRRQSLDACLVGKKFIKVIRFIWSLRCEKTLFFRYVWNWG